VACHRFHVVCLRPSLCAMWHGLSLAMCHVACVMPCLGAMWDGLDLAVPHGMA